MRIPLSSVGLKVTSPAQLTMRSRLAELREELGRQAEPGPAHVAGHRHAARTHEVEERGGVLEARAQGIEDRRGDDLAEEAFLRRRTGAGAREHEDLFDLRVAIEQEGERHLADEAGGSDEEDATARERRWHVERLHREREAKNISARAEWLLPSVASTVTVTV